MARFSIIDTLNAQSRPEEGRGAGFEIRHIPLERLRPAEDNPYGIRDVEEMAASIEQFGLMHNLVVRPADANGIHEIESGERRYRACKLLLEGGNEAYRAVPCLVTEPGGNPHIAELRLLQANSTARELTDYEKMQQAVRTRQLLEALRDSGYPIKGRMRDIVADMLGVSPAQEGRLQKIARDLSPEAQDKFRAGEIGVTQAYELATLPAERRSKALAEGGAAETDEKPERRERTKKEAPPQEAREDPAEAGGTEIVDFTILSRPTHIAFDCPHCEAANRIPWEQVDAPSCWGDAWPEMACAHCGGCVKLGKYEYD